MKAKSPSSAPWMKFISVKAALLGQHLSKNVSRLSALSIGLVKL